MGGNVSVRAATISINEPKDTRTPLAAVMAETPRVEGCACHHDTADTQGESIAANCDLGSWWILKREGKRAGADDASGGGGRKGCAGYGNGRSADGKGGATNGETGWICDVGLTGEENLGRA